MSLNKTPNANRFHIGIFGKRNTGKSSLINAITNQNVSIISEIAGTTTDPVKKTMEIHGLGPCLFIDTAGFDDGGELGELRNKKTLQTSEIIDAAIVLINNKSFKTELEFINKLKDIPIIIVINRCDTLNPEDLDALSKDIFEKTKIKPVVISAKEHKNISQIIDKLIEIKPFINQSITEDLVNPKDLVMLVMPQNIQAPQGRLILPQVQTIRDLLDNKCMTLCVTTENFVTALEFLNKPPKLIITDSQEFDYVYKNKPQESLLSSFSILFAKYKGDIHEFIRGSHKIDEMNESSVILIAEACTHVPLEEDIGRVKIPRLLKKRLGANLKIDHITGNNFPDDLSKYDLIVHCGSCMFNRKFMMSRIKKARESGVAITNYGVLIAKLNGILDKICF